MSSTLLDHGSSVSGTAGNGHFFGSTGAGALGGSLNLIQWGSSGSACASVCLVHAHVCRVVHALACVRMMCAGACHAAAHVCAHVPV